MMPPSDEIRAEIETTHPAEGTVALWWLGQASVLLKGAGGAAYIDPFFSEMPARLVPPPFPPEEAPPADLVLVTHDHLDHLDENTLPGMARAAPDARFVAPEPLRARLTDLGIARERVVGAVADESVRLGNIDLVPVPAMHAFRASPAAYDFGHDPDGRDTYLGYVLDIGGVRVYHAGDTVVYDGMVQRLRALEINLALLPINGRSYFREQQDIVGNTDEREAAQLAAEAGIRAIAPIHYEMFAGNLGRPAALVEYARDRHPELTIILPAHGRRLTYTRGG